MNDNHRFRFARAALACACLAFAGCFGLSRDNPADPHNTPIFRVMAADYDPGRGAVRISWDYLSRDEPDLFEVYRGIGEQEERIGAVRREDLVAASEVPLSFLDTAPVAGESTHYWIVLTRNNMHIGQSDPVQVVIPGLRIGWVETSLSAGHFKVVWQGNTDGVAALQVYRRIGDGPEERVFQSDNPDDASFSDTRILGNIDYSYAIQSLMTSGAQIRSAPARVRIYERLRIPLAIGNPEAAEARYRLYINPWQGGRRVQALVFSPSDVQNKLYGVVYNPRGNTHSFVLENTRALSMRPFDLALVSVAPSSFHYVSLGVGQAFVADFEASTRHAVLMGFGDSVDPVFSTRWPVPEPVARTAMAVDAVSKRLFVTAGRHLQIFDENLDPTGTASVDAGEPGDLLVTSDGLWAALPDEGLLLKGQAPSGGSEAIPWRTVALPPGSIPVALVANLSEQVLVLDAGLSRILVLDSDGQPVMDVVLPERNWSDGDLVVNADTNWLQVVDSAGLLYTFQP